ncbi:MAG: hypothetical protein ACRDNZ_06800, partial [Streptosporangiaceae bacterium]
MANVSYVPGALTAVAGDSCLALVEAAPDSPAAAWIWQRVGQGASAEVLLAGLLGAGFDGVGGFTLLDESVAGRPRLFCRGAVSATVVGGTTAEGAAADVAASVRIDGVGLLTWREHVVAADAERIFLGQPPDDGALRLPAAAGVLLAGCVIVDLTEIASRAATRPDFPTGGYADVSGPGDGGYGSGRAVIAHPDTVAAVRVAVEPATTAVISLASLPGIQAFPLDKHSRERAVALPGGSGVVGGAPAGGAASVAGSGDCPPGPPGDDNDYDSFWGATMARSVEEAAIRQADGNASVGILGRSAPAGPFQSAGSFHGPAGLSSALQPAVPPANDQPWQPPPGTPDRMHAAAAAPDSGPAPGAAPPLPMAPDGLIDAVSWGAGPGAPAAPSAHRMPQPVVAPVPAPGPEENGFTVKRAGLAGLSVSPPDRIGPAVPALICPAGHVNPPSEASCRQCGAALPQDPVVVPRPVLGVLRLSTGDVLTLDRDVVMGRSPRADFTGANGEDRPHVVKLPSADGDISRTHLRVTLSGWHVLVTD